MPVCKRVVVQLEADEGDAVFLQLTGAAQAHGAGADDGVHAGFDLCAVILVPFSPRGARSLDYAGSMGSGFNGNRRLRGVGLVRNVSTALEGVKS
ncbi:hypothetical protein THL1_2314 [Pseudomonas sp. TCU-HL1]|nr:hypothetical protein THL1_2314 [Pseudomonas sp. TCU-HL1]